MATDQKKQVVLVKFRGKSAWAKVHPGQEQVPFKVNKYNEHDRHYEILVECAEDLYKKLLKAGVDSRTTLKTSEQLKVDGNSKYIKLKATKVRGDLTFPDPEVTDKDGIPISNLIGNGSEVEAVAELATNSEGGKVLRLKKVRVLDLVEYEGPSVETVDFNVDESTPATNNDNKADPFY